MKKSILSLLIALCALLPSAGAAATPWGSSETISYQLYFNWKFIWVKAGVASMTTTPITYQGKKCNKTSLVTKTSSKVDKFFMMRDTLVSYFNDDTTPIYYRKGAREGKRYYVDEVWYSYGGGKCTANMKHLYSDGTIHKDKQTYDRNVTDMLNSFMRIRGMNPTGWKEGHTENLYISGGSQLTMARLVYKGKDEVKGDDKKKYKCLVLSYQEKDDKKYKEIVKFYVTDDARHIPIRLDLNLRFGSAKAFITNIK